MKTILLASKSPRRKKILLDAGYEIFVVENGEEEMNIVGQQYDKNIVNLCAKMKTQAAYEILTKNLTDTQLNIFHHNNIIVSADTVVVNDGIIYGKPKDKLDAIRMLKSLSGKMHIVVTSICVGYYINKNEYIIHKEKKYSDIFLLLAGTEETKVYFKNITEEEIEKYVEQSKPFDKAGAYGIQDEEFTFLDKIEGNIDNVIGFPMKKYKELLSDLNM